MSGKRYTEEFKSAAVKQVAQRGHPVSEVAERLGVSIHSLYAWVKRYGVPEEERKAVDGQSDEQRRLKAELKPVTEERDILKKAACTLPRRPGKVHIDCRASGQLFNASALQDARGAPSGFYAWRFKLESKRAKEDKRLLVPIKQSGLESGAVYGYRKVSDDLRELGEPCGINRVHRLMRSAGIRSQTGYGKRRYKRGGAPSLVGPNHLQRQFDVNEPNRVWGDGHNLYPYLRRLVVPGRRVGLVFTPGRWVVDELAH